MTKPQPPNDTTQDKPDWRERMESLCLKHRMNEQNAVYDDADIAFEAGFTAGCKDALTSPEVREIVHSLKSEIAEVRRLESKPLFRSVEALKQFEKALEDLE